ncbi:hypothetical protein SKAU_G00182550 [Synaphobranchus kaupii]|uniref:Uncharacterized protein n=1 Tax=Synaphobranchus kaupii TaxID=118154 RepID=A0A9Q1FC62_SYNKA|nr:hypothetical protein SKAU_G00182550 [Synaphobranchus kaupii]
MTRRMATGQTAPSARADFIKNKLREKPKYGFSADLGITDSTGVTFSALQQKQTTTLRFLLGQKRRQTPPGHGPADGGEMVGSEPQSQSGRLSAFRQPEPLVTEQMERRKDLRRGAAVRKGAPRTGSVEYPLHLHIQSIYLQPNERHQTAGRLHVQGVSSGIRPFTSDPLPLGCCGVMDYNSRETRVAEVSAAQLPIGFVTLPCLLKSFLSATGFYDTVFPGCVGAPQSGSRRSAQASEQYPRSSDQRDTFHTAGSEAQNQTELRDPANMPSAGTIRREEGKPAPYRTHSKESDR